MTHYESNTTLAQIAEILAGDRRVLITTHAKPDGDALGAVAALAAALEQKQIAVERWLMPPVLESLRWLVEGAPLYIHGGEDDVLPQGEPDHIVIVDTGAWSQLEPLQPWLEPRHARIIVVDHHLHGDDVGATRFIDGDAAAACEIVVDLIDALGATLTLPIANALYAGIASDTGWFRFSNARAQTFELAGRLVALGVDNSRLYQRIEQWDRHEKLLLLIRALDSLQLVADGRAAVMALRKRDFTETGARLEETERLVDLPQLVRDIQLVVLMTELADGQVRLSFRSKHNDEAVDVNRLAREFGGGGHARAAGARLDGRLEDVHRQVIDKLQHLLG